MPQLDTLTFFSQALTMLVLVSLFFILIISVVLPTLFRIQKVRAYICSNDSKGDTSFSAYLLKLFQFENYVISETFSNSSQFLESLTLDCSEFELLPEDLEILDEIITELCYESFDFYIAVALEDEDGKSSLFDLEDDFEKTTDNA